MILRERRLRSQHGGVLRDFVIQWYADDEGEIFCRTSHVFVRRIEPVNSRCSPKLGRQLRDLERALSTA